MKYVIISFIVLIFGITGFLAPLRDVVVGVISPVQFGLRKMAFDLKEMTRFFSSVNKVRQENLMLLEKLSSLESQNIELKIIRDQNELLKKQLEVEIGSQNNKSLLLVDVMGNPSDPSGGTVLLSAGTNNGIKVGDNVVIGINLIGIIKSANASVSAVELITSPNLSLTAYDLDVVSKTEGLIRGQHGSVLSFERILPGEDLRVGDLILTSGKDGVFMTNLSIGKIIEIQDDPSQPLKKATVKPDIEFSKLKQVFVVISR